MGIENLILESVAVSNIENLAGSFFTFRDSPVRARIFKGWAALDMANAALMATGNVMSSTVAFGGVVACIIAPVAIKLFARTLSARDFPITSFSCKLIDKHMESLYDLATLTSTLALVALGFSVTTPCIAFAFGCQTISWTLRIIKKLGQPAQSINVNRPPLSAASNTEPSPWWARETVGEGGFDQEELRQAEERSLQEAVPEVVANIAERRANIRGRSLPDVSLRERECSICQDTTESSSVEMRCGHIFHKICISHWVKAEDGAKNLSCPDCRESLDGDTDSKNRPFLHRAIHLDQDAA
jgi:hypothetical protein